LVENYDCGLPTAYASTSSKRSRPDDRSKTCNNAIPTAISSNEQKGEEKERAMVGWKRFHLQNSETQGSYFSAHLFPYSERNEKMLATII